MDTADTPKPLAGCESPEFLGHPDRVVSSASVPRETLQCKAPLDGSLPKDVLDALLDEAGGVVE